MQHPVCCAWASGMQPRQLKRHLRLCNRSQRWLITSFRLIWMQLVATACLYLSCKVQESPKYLRDVIKEAERKKWEQYAREHPAELRKWDDVVSVPFYYSQALAISRPGLHSGCCEDVRPALHHHGIHVVLAAMCMSQVHRIVHPEQSQTFLGSYMSRLI